MVSSMAARRAKTRKGRKVIADRESKLVENPKVLAVVRGHSTSATVNNVLTELHVLRNPLSKRFSRKNVIRPFEAAGEVPLETLLSKADCSLFALGNHTKKRPHNLILGRTFDGHILDMIEFAITNFKSMSEFPAKKAAVGSKPCLLFKGDFATNEDLRKCRSILLDIFRGQEVQELDLAGLERFMSVEVKTDKSILLRNHMIRLKKSGGKLPKVELEEMGPSIELTVRRTQFASSDLLRMAMKQPRSYKNSKVKNTSIDEGLGDKMGRVYVERQEIDKLALRKMKGLKKNRLNESTEATDEAMDEDGEGEDIEGEEEEEY